MTVNERLISGIGYSAFTFGLLVAASSAGAAIGRMVDGDAARFWGLPGAAAEFGLFVAVFFVASFVYGSLVKDADRVEAAGIWGGALALFGTAAWVSLDRTQEAAATFSLFDLVRSSGIGVALVSALSALAASLAGVRFGSWTIASSRRSLAKSRITGLLLSSSIAVTIAVMLAKAFDFVALGAELAPWHVTALAVVSGSTALAYGMWLHLRAREREGRMLPF